VLPKPQDRPSVGAQLLVGAAISHAIAEYFGSPVFPVVLRHPITPGTTVPKATIYEYCYALCPESEVGFSRERQMSAPSGYARPAQER